MRQAAAQAQGTQAQGTQAQGTQAQDAERKGEPRPSEVASRWLRAAAARQGSPSLASSQAESEAPPEIASRRSGIAPHRSEMKLEQRGPDCEGAENQGVNGAKGGGRGSGADKKVVNGQQLAGVKGSGEGEEEAGAQGRLLRQPKGGDSCSAHSRTPRPSPSPSLQP